MSTVIISSTQDTASTNIKNGLLSQSGWEDNGQFFGNSYYKSTIYSDLFLITIQDRTVIHEHLEEEIITLLRIKPTKAMFISRHRSKSGKPTLSTHPIGNFGEAKFGGKPQMVSPTLPHHMTELLRIIYEKKQQESLPQKVCFEVTHHGPYMSIPTLFAEVGSTEEEWKKQRPANLIATAVLTLLDRFDEINKRSKDIPVLLGVGGGHYAPRFTDVALEKQVAFAHMIPSYHLDQGSITFDIFERVVDVSSPLYGIYLHRKALKKSQQTMVKKWCEDIDLPVVSSNDFCDIA